MIMSTLVGIAIITGAFVQGGPCVGLAAIVPVGFVLHVIAQTIIAVRRSS